MNLQEIQKRMAELAAEMSDLSNKMSSVIGVQAVDPKALTHWTQLCLGNRIHTSKPFVSPYSEDIVRSAGVYIIVALETPSYDGKLTAHVKPQTGMTGHSFWIDAQELIRLGILTKI